MLQLSCLFCQVNIEIGKKPEYINECNCTLSSKSGARWAYFHPSEIAVEGTTQGYSREDKADPNTQIRFCPRCGATTHFVLTESAISRLGKNSLTGVNMRLANERGLVKIELRYPDGRAWLGEGSFGYVQDLRVIGK